MKEEPMLHLLLAAATLFAAPDDPRSVLVEVPLAEVAGGVLDDFLPLGDPDGALDVFIIRTDGTVFLAEGGYWSLTDDAVEFYAVTFGALFKDQPTKFTTQYMDVPGNVHTVVTDCKDFRGINECVAAHMRAVAAMQRAYKPAPLTQKPPGELH